MAEYVAASQPAEELAPEPAPEWTPEPERTVSPDRTSVSRAADAVVPDAPVALPVPVRRAPVRSAAVRVEAPIAHPTGEGDESTLERGATAPQLRRFIKSRAYVPMHELRRRFAINGGDDEVTPVDVDRHRVYVGLPEREGRLLGELLRGGDIGYELSMDPISPIVVGVYPMRPVTRA